MSKKVNNVDVEAIERTAAAVAADPAAARLPVELGGEWRFEGSPQFVGEIPLPTGARVRFEADFPPALGGGGTAPNPVAYCLWGGVACYAMTFALEAARAGVELRALRARVETTVDQRRALGVTDAPPVEHLVWTLAIESDASDSTVDELKALADARCPGVYCITNPIALTTRVERI